MRRITGNLARAALDMLFPLWGRKTVSQDGYTIVVPTPSDMPFLLKAFFRAVLHTDLTHCQAILVVPDGRCSDMASLHGVMDECRTLPTPVRLLPLTRLQRFAANHWPSKDGGANIRHWLTIIRGVGAAHTTHVILHDIDAFWHTADTFETLYDECRQLNCDALGLSARWDQCFTDRNIKMPGTWELTFRTEWATRFRASDHKGGMRSEKHASDMSFDTMLWPQFHSYDTGRIRISQTPPRITHFNGTITTFRVFELPMGQGIVDELFRVLLLSVIETAVNQGACNRLTPGLESLERGLTNLDARVRFDSETNRRGYAEFRNMVDQMIESPAFCGNPGHSINLQLRQFDEHFGYVRGKPHTPALTANQIREHNLGQRKPDR